MSFKSRKSYVVSSSLPNSPRRGEGRLLFLRLILFCLFLLAPHAVLADFSDHAHLISPPQKAPPLVFEDARQVQHTLSDYRGRFVLLNLWATWCTPCVKEMPSLDALQKDMGVQLAVLPVSEDRGDTAVSAFYARHGLTQLPVAVDAAGIAPSAFQTKGLPTTFLIDPQGQEVARFEGTVAWDSPEVLAFLRAQINATSHP